MWWMTPKNNRAPLLCYLKLFASFRSYRWIQTGVTVWKRLIWVKIDDFFSRVTLQIDGWPYKTIGHIRYATPSFVHHFVAIGEFKLELQSRNAQSGSNSTIFFSLWLWNLTDDLKNHWTPLLSDIKLYATFHLDFLVQTGVTVRKRLSWVVTSVTLTFCMDITSVIGNNKIAWLYDDGNIVKRVSQTDRLTGSQTDRRTDWAIELLGRS